MGEGRQDHVHGDLTVDELGPADVDTGLDPGGEVGDLDPGRAGPDVLAAWRLAGRPVFHLEVGRVDQCFDPTIRPWKAAWAASFEAAGFWAASLAMVIS